MSRTWTYPGPEFPQLTPVEVTTPDDWAPVEAPGVSLAVGESDAAADGFRSNVVVTVTHMPDEYDLDAAGRDLDASIGALDDPHVITDGTLSVSGRTARVKEVVYREPAVGTLIQSHVLTLVVQDHGADLVHATATCGGDRDQAHVDVLRSILSGMDVPAGRRGAHHR